MSRVLVALVCSCAVASAAPPWPGETHASTDRVAAVRALPKLGPKVAAQALGGLLKDPDVEVRAAAAESAGLLALFDPALVSLASAPEAKVRAAAVTALGSVTGPRAEDEHAIDSAIVRALGDDEPLVRGAALHAIDARRSAGKSAVEAVTALLGDERPELRRGAAEVAARLDDRAALPALAGHIDDPSPEVRIAIAHALGALGDVRAAPAALRLVDDGSDDVRAAAIATLGALAAPVAVSRLVGVLAVPRAPLAGIAAIALGRIAAGEHAGETKTEVALRRRAGDALVGAVRRNENRAPALEGIRASGAAAERLLGGLMPARGAAADEAIVAVARDLCANGDAATTARLLATPTTDGRFDALLEAARPPAGPARDALVAWLAARLGDASATVRRRAALSLGALGDRSVVPVLEPLAHDPDEATRRAAVLALIALDAVAPAALVDALRSTDGDVRTAAAMALAGRSATPVVPELIALFAQGAPETRAAAALALSGPLRGHADPTARALALSLVATDTPAAGPALELLGAMRDATAAGRLGAMLDALPEVRRVRALAVLGDLALGGARPKELLHSTSARPTAAARAAAAWALGKLDRQKLQASDLATLKRLATDADANVRTNAESALRRLQGKAQRGDGYVLIRLAGAPGNYPASARLTLPDGLVEVVPVDERGFVRDEGVPAGVVKLDLGDGPR